MSVVKSAADATPPAAKIAAALSAAQAAAPVAPAPTRAPPAPTKATPVAKALATFASATPEEEATLRAARLRADFDFAGYCCLAKIVEFYDGDTVRAAFLPQRGIAQRGAAERGIATSSMAPIQYKVRMNGYDSPEMRPLKTHPDREGEKKAAEAARAALIGKVGDDLVAMVCGGFDKYGRILATLYTRDGEDINAWMIASHHGRPYDGKTKEKWDAPRQQSPRAIT